VVLTRRGDIARVYLLPAANCLLSVADHCFDPAGTSTWS
jgi:xylulose-5-phosphate/fructose-6-phosphate phosphoketolase